LWLWREEPFGSLSLLEVFAYAEFMTYGLNFREAHSTDHVTAKDKRLNIDYAAAVNGNVKD